MEPSGFGNLATAVRTELQLRGSVAVKTNGTHFRLPILVLGLVDVHWGCDLGFDPWPCVTLFRVKRRTRTQAQGGLASERQAFLPSGCYCITGTGLD